MSEQQLIDELIQILTGIKVQELIDILTKLLNP